jgi:hypothetical protein
MKNLRKKILVSTLILFGWISVPSKAIVLADKHPWIFYCIDSGVTTSIGNGCESGSIKCCNNPCPSCPVI